MAFIEVEPLPLIVGVVCPQLLSKFYQKQGFKWVSLGWFMLRFFLPFSGRFFWRFLRTPFEADNFRLPKIEMSSGPLELLLHRFLAVYALTLCP